MAHKKKRSAEELAEEKPYMVFDERRGFVWGPAHATPGELPYWNTGKVATWARKDDVDTGEKNP